jgi:hypothetical protein
VYLDHYRYGKRPEVAIYGRELLFVPTSRDKLTAALLVRYFDQPLCRCMRGRNPSPRPDWVVQVQVAYY